MAIAENVGGVYNGSDYDPRLGWMPRFVDPNITGKDRKVMDDETRNRLLQERYDAINLQKIVEKRKQQARESVEDVFHPHLCLEKECECEHPFKTAPPDLGASLDTAKAIITGERQDQYGDPEDSFAIIAGYWEVYLANRKPGPLTALDTAHMLTLFKIARCTGQAPKRDNYIDGQGYLAIAADRLIPAMEGSR